MKSPLSSEQDLTKNQKFGPKLGVFQNYTSIPPMITTVILVVIHALVQTKKLVTHATLVMNNKQTVLAKL